MKTINNWITIICVIASFGFTLVSCTDEGENTRKNDSRTVQLTLSAPANEVVSPMTKGVATSINETINNICVLIYDKSGNIIADESFYRSTDGGNDEGISDIQNNTAGHTYYLNLADDNTRTIYVVANVGNKIPSWTTTDAINGVYNLENVGGQMLPKCILFANGQTFSSADQVVTAELKRIYAKITVVVDASGVKDATITPSSVALKNIPITGSLATNKIKESPSDSEYLSDGGSIELARMDDKKWGSHAEGTTAFFMYENMQPEGYCIEGDQTSKTPKSIGQVSKNPGTVKNDKACSYIELSTKYDASAIGNGTGTVTYRFFLGNDVFKNFEVERNTHYKVTLNLTGNGGIDEASWRVEADIQGKFTPHDAYVGYLVNSKSRIYIDGGSGLKDNSWTLSHEDGSNVVDLVSNSLKQDENGYYLEVKARETNISDRTEYPGVYIVSTKGIEREVTVTQVRRIMEPIGYYRNHNNNYTDHVIVKEFNLSSRSFEALESVGSWSAEIIKGGNWFTITPTEGTEYAGTNGTKVSGNSGAIKFDFEPNGNDNKYAANYGCILVKYHNEMCEHRIFVRQGYEDTDLGDGTYWRAMNTTMQYPTMSGALYQGGTAAQKEISPYNPGFNIDGKVDNWLGKNEDTDRGKWAEGNDVGKLCPNGYHVPHIKAYSYIRQQCYRNSQGNYGIQAFIGYVHDDSNQNATFENPLGWKWSNHNATITTNNNYDYECNPAKGTILVKDDDYTNIFFPYGKGILEHKNKYADYETTIDEIGVGRRNGKKLYCDELGNPSYGATYWSGTNSIDKGLGNHMLYCRFWSLLKLNIPFYVSDGSIGDTGENYSGGFVIYKVSPIESWDDGKRGPIGEDRFGSASFVRCVKNNSKKYTDRSDYNN